MNQKVIKVLTIVTMDAVNDTSISLTVTTILYWCCQLSSAFTDLRQPIVMLFVWTMILPPGQYQI